MIVLLCQLTILVCFGRLAQCRTLKSEDIGESGNRNTDDLFVVSCPQVAAEYPVYLPDPKDCSSFYICDSGIPRQQKCPLGLHFNRKIDACDYPRNAKCNSENENKPKGRKTDNELDSCPSENSEIPVYLPHIECSKFFACDNGTPHLKECPAGLHFNVRQKVCDFPESAKCERDTDKKLKEGKSRDGMITCPAEQSEIPVFVPHPDDCTKFFICDRGLAFLKKCPPGLHFNSYVKACDYPKSAGCNSDLKAERKKRMVNSEQEDLCSLHQNGRLAFLRHPTDCQNFFICNNKSGFPLSCPPGLHINIEKGVCDYPKNANCDESMKLKQKASVDDFFISCPSDDPQGLVFHPHPTDCDKFYTCEEGEPVLKKCPFGLNYNEKTQVCDFSENERCDKRLTYMSEGVSSPFCPERNGKMPIFFRHPTNCTVYYMCGNGLAYEFTCPARLHFNLRKKVCDYEDSANCPVSKPKM